MRISERETPRRFKTVSYHVNLMTIQIQCACFKLKIRTFSQMDGIEKSWQINL